MAVSQDRGGLGLGEMAQVDEEGNQDRRPGNLPEATQPVTQSRG